MFDELFPTTSRRFDVGAPPANAWGMAETDERMMMWTCWLFSDDLMRLAASFRTPDTDLFSRPKFWGKFEALRVEMANKRGTPKRDMVRQDDRPEWQGFIEYRLTDAELAELDEWKPKPLDVLAAVDQMLNTGYRLTLSYNARTHLASCTVIDDDSSRKSGGFGMSSADVDGAAVLKMAVYKHQKLQGDWTALMGDDRPKGRRG